MIRKAKRSISTRSTQRIFWWSGIACLAGSAAAVFLDIPPTIIVSLGAVGLFLCLISIGIEVRRKGFNAETVQALSSCLALSFGVFGYFYHHIDWALFTAIGGFLFFVFVNMGAQVAEQWGETKDLWRRWKQR